MDSHASVVRLQDRAPRFSIPFRHVSLMNLQVGESLQCNFWGPDGIITSFSTKVPASREVHVPRESAEKLQSPHRFYLVELRRLPR